MILISCSPDTRKRIILLDSGIEVTTKNKKHLCEDGHRTFIENDNDQFKDTTGHGTCVSAAKAAASYYSF